MANNSGNEALFRNDLKKLMEKYLGPDLQEHRLKIEENAKVLYDITVDVKDDRMEPRLGFLEQDIVLFQWATVPEKLGRHFFKVRNTSRSEIRIPRLIVELKYKGISSHTLITYSNIATRIKGIFGDVRYFLLLRYDNKGPETMLRHGAGFDRIFQLARTTGATDYAPGAFEKHLVASADLRDRFEIFIRTIRRDLRDKKLISPAKARLSIPQRDDDMASEVG
jgi:hypothetical protein